MVIINMLTIIYLAECMMYQFAGLTKNKQFREVYGKGKSVPERLIVLYFKPNDLGFNRFGFSVGKKVGNAVVRNRIKRILREVCRLNLEKVKKGYDYVIIARPRIVEEDYFTIEKSFLKLLKKAGLAGNEMSSGEKNCNNSN